MRGDTKQIFFPPQKEKKKSFELQETEAVCVYVCVSLYLILAPDMKLF